MVRMSRKQLIVLLLFSLAVATAVKAVTIPPRAVFESHSLSASEAKRNGTLVTEVDVQPTEIVLHGKTIQFQEAWIEERFHERDMLVWFPYNARLGGYNLCLTVVDKEDTFSGTQYPFFVLDDRKSSFGRLYGPSSMSFWYCPLESADIAAVRASLIATWTEPREKNIRFSEKGSGEAD